MFLSVRSNKLAEERKQTADTACLFPQFTPWSDKFLRNLSKVFTRLYGTTSQDENLFLMSHHLWNYTFFLPSTRSRAIYLPNKDETHFHCVIYVAIMSSCAFTLFSCRQRCSVYTDLYSVKIS
jgi:hypothetical protein